MTRKSTSAAAKPRAEPEVTFQTHPKKALDAFMRAADKWNAANNATAESATNALVRAGILTKKGNLTKNYRG
jgi:hypothetical protein